MADDVVAGIYANLLLARRPPRLAPSPEGRDPRRGQRASDPAALRHQRALAHGAAIDVGVEVGARVTVADDPALLESAFRTALSRADLVIATGGLGPTEDDLTREAAAAALGRGLRRDPGDPRGPEGALRQVSSGRWRRPTRSRPTSSRGPSCSRTPAAPRPASGSTTGAACSCCSPGPPSEMKPMFEEQVLPRGPRAGGRGPARRPASSRSRRCRRATSTRPWPPSTRPSRTRAPRSCAPPARWSCT